MNNCILFPAFRDVQVLCVVTSVSPPNHCFIIHVAGNMIEESVTVVWIRPALISEYLDGNISCSYTEFGCLDPCRVRKRAIYCLPN
jgi:hypothetical protein